MEQNVLAGYATVALASILDPVLCQNSALLK